MTDLHLVDEDVRDLEAEDPRGWVAAWVDELVEWPDRLRRWLASGQVAEDQSDG